MKIELVIPWIPPSANNCYVTIWSRRQRVLTKDAAAFKSRVSAHVASVYAAELGELARLPESVVFNVTTNLYLPRSDVMTATYGKKGGAANRYKRMDIANRTKLLEDAVFEALGKDDSLIFSEGVRKLCDSLVGGKPQSIMFIEAKEAADFGF